MKHRKSDIIKYKADIFSRITKNICFLSGRSFRVIQLIFDSEINSVSVFVLAEMGGENQFSVSVFEFKFKLAVNGNKIVTDVFQPVFNAAFNEDFTAFVSIGKGDCDIDTGNACVHVAFSQICTEKILSVGESYSVFVVGHTVDFNFCEELTVYF